MNPITALSCVDKTAFNKVRRAYQKRLATFPANLEPMPDEEFNAIVSNKSDLNPPRKAWRSAKFLVQLFKEGNNFRLSVNRCKIDKKGQWVGDITWDELMECKRQCGYGSLWATEVYPPDDQIVNVANMRHLFLVNEPPQYAWKKPV